MASNLSGPYPYQIAGPKTTFETKVTSKGLFARVDMPGVALEGEIRIKVCRDSVLFSGEARDEQVRMRYPRPRTYKGGFTWQFPLDPTCHIKCLMKNGVLRFFIPAVLSDETVAETSLFVTLPLPLPSAEEENRDRNPFQLGGVKWTIEHFITNHDKLFLRIDLPGVNEVTWPNSSSPDQRWVNFRCEAPPPPEWEIEDKLARTYAGTIRLDCECCFVKGVDPMFSNGILTVIVSKRKMNSNPNAKCDLASH